MATAEAKSSSTSPSNDQIVNEPEISEDIQELAAKEASHELIALNYDKNAWGLQVGAFYNEQWKEIEKILDSKRRSRACATSTGPESLSNESTPDMIGDKVFVISLLGNTSCGKSYLTKCLLQNSEGVDASDYPYVPDESEKTGATTTNINCYMNGGIAQQQTLILDYEGEKGPGFPFMHHAQKYLSRVSQTAQKVEERRKAITEYFPKLAYVLSDVVLLLGTQDLTSTDYITRCLEFARAANDNVDQVVNPPILIIVQNKAPVFQSTSYEATTTKYSDIHKTDWQKLKGYFSDIHCIVLPHREQLQRYKGHILDGEKIFEERIEEMKHMLNDISRRRLDEALTRSEWLYLLKRVLVHVQNKQKVSLHSLLQEIATVDNHQVDQSRLCFLYAYKSSTIQSAEWFEKCHEFAVSVLAYLMARNVPRERKIIPEKFFQKECQQALAELWERLDEFQPCQAQYPGKGHRSKKSSNQGPIYCYQHKGAHKQGHRTCEPVYGLRLFGFSCMDVWDGEFVAPCNMNGEEAGALRAAIDNLWAQVESLMEQFEQEPNRVYAMFIELLSNSSFQNVKEVIACVCFCNPGDSNMQSSSSTAASSHTNQRQEKNWATFWKRILNWFRRFAQNQPETSIPIRCKTCYQKLQSAIDKTSQSSHTDPVFQE